MAGTRDSSAFFGEIIDVRKYGAKLDGITDDTTAINNALLAGARVLINGDNCLVNGSIVLNSNNILISETDIKITTTVDDGYITIGGSFITIKGIHFFNASGIGQFSSVEKATTSDITIEDCEFEGCQIGRLQVGNFAGGIGDNSIITKNKVHGMINVMNGMFIVFASNLTITYNEVYNNDGEGIKVAAKSASTYAKVNYNFCHDNNRDGIDLFDGGFKGECIGNVLVDNAASGIEIKFPPKPTTYVDDGASINAEKFIVSQNVCLGSSIGITGYASNIIMTNNYSEGELICGGWNSICSNNIVVAKESQRGISGKGLKNGRISNNTVLMTIGDATNRPIYLSAGDASGGDLSSVTNQDVIIENNTIDAGGFSRGIFVEAMEAGNIAKIKNNNYLNILSSGFHGGIDYVDSIETNFITNLRGNLTDYASVTGVTGATTNFNMPIKTMSINESLSIEYWVNYSGAAGGKSETLFVGILGVNTFLATLLNNIDVSGLIKYNVLITRTASDTLQIIYSNTNDNIENITTVAGLTGLITNDTKFFMQLTSPNAGTVFDYNKMIYKGVEENLLVV